MEGEVRDYPSRMKETFEIRMHSKSGQGAKTVAQFIAEAGADEGKHVQAYAEFGAERIGAPMVAFARISENPIKTHAPVVKPDVVMVFDDSIVEYSNVAEGLKEDGFLLVNTTKKKNYFEKTFGTKAKINTIDATKISIDCLGEARPNMPMLGALLKLIDIIEMDAVINSIKDKFIPKIGAKKTADNVKAFREGYKALEK